MSLAFHFPLKTEYGDCTSMPAVLCSVGWAASNKHANAYPRKKILLFSPQTYWPVLLMLSKSSNWAACLMTWAAKSRNSPFSSPARLKHTGMHQAMNQTDSMPGLCQTAQVSGVQNGAYIFKKPINAIAPLPPIRGAGIAQWLEHRTRGWKVAGSNPCWNGGRIFFSRVDFLCWLLFRYPFHPRVTAVARKKSRSFCRKCRWQVTAKHAYTLRMWILLNRASALVTTCP